MPVTPSQCPDTGVVVSLGFAGIPGMPVQPDPTCFSAQDKTPLGL